MKAVKVLMMISALVTATVSHSFAQGVVNLSAPEAKALLAKKSGIVLLDVRTPEEYRQAHLRGAMLIPLDQLEKRVREVPRDKPVLLYCAVGARSNTAARLLASKGYRDLYHIADGIVGWYKSGFPIEKGR